MECFYAVVLNTKYSEVFVRRWVEHAVLCSVSNYITLLILPKLKRGKNVFPSFTRFFPFKTEFF